jgi:hypothetical protein
LGRGGGSSLHGARRLGRSGGRLSHFRQLGGPRWLCSRSGGRRRLGGPRRLASRERLGGQQLLGARRLASGERLGGLALLGGGRLRWPHCLAAHHEALGRHRGSGLLGAALLQDLLDRSGSLIILERGRVALDVVTERHQLGHDLLVVELNTVVLELLGDFVDALLRHTLLGLLLRRLPGAAP